MVRLPVGDRGRGGDDGQAQVGIGLRRRRRRRLDGGAAVVDVRQDAVLIL